MNQALLALRDILNPGRGVTGLVVSTGGGQCVVATRNGTRAYPVAPGLVLAVDQRVLIEGGLVVRAMGTSDSAPTFYV